MNEFIKKNFCDYAGAVIQNRAIPEVVDNLKPGARQILYCMYTDKFVHSKPYQKTLKAIGSSARVFWHGDASCLGVIMRLGQPFATRYPLIEIEGSCGNLQASGNYAAPRYTASRLSALSEYLFKDLDKSVIDEWRDNYDETEQYPVYLPCKGFYPIVNGGLGIGVGLSSSIPQYNLKEVNDALIKLLWEPDIDEDKIICLPDFSTGGYLLNENEVRESIKQGHGSSCKIRSAVEYEPKEHCFVVTEVPYGTYTNTICKQLEEIIESDKNPGIERFNDLTGLTANLKIYLLRNANPDKVLKYLYKNTSLENYYGINFTMLEKGRYPKVFTWKEMLQAHLDHEKEIYVRGFSFDLNKINKRLHIIDGLLKAISIIDEVITLIKGAADTSNAMRGLMIRLNFTEAQAKAILEIKLAKLAHLEITKLKKEKDGLIVQKTNIEKILKNETLLKKEIEKGLHEVADKFGDARRTKILNIAKDDEVIEAKSAQLLLTNKNNILLKETSTLYTQSRKSVGTNLKLEKDEYIINSISFSTDQSILFFSQSGNYYSYKLNDAGFDQKISLYDLLKLKPDDMIIACAKCSDDNKYLMLFTKNGICKKTNFNEYTTGRNGACKAIALDEDDLIMSVIIDDDSLVGIATEKGNFLMTDTSQINSTGRVTHGVRIIKLDSDDFLKTAKVIRDASQIVSITKNGLIKRTSIDEFTTQLRNTKGKKIQKLDKADSLCDILPIDKEKTIMVASLNNLLKLKIDDTTLYSSNSHGTMCLPKNKKAIALSY